MPLNASISLKGAIMSALMTPMALLTTLVMIANAPLTNPVMPDIIFVTPPSIPPIAPRAIPFQEVINLPIPPNAF